jgi:hypothetical protein
VDDDGINNLYARQILMGTAQNKARRDADANVPLLIAVCDILNLVCAARNALFASLNSLSIPCTEMKGAKTQFASRKI